MTQLRYLSEEWLAALGELVAAASVAEEGERTGEPAASPDGAPEPEQGRAALAADDGTGPAAVSGAGRSVTSVGAPDRPLRLGQVVAGGPDGEVAYTLVLGGDDAGVVAGVDDADVTLVGSYETARAMAAGEMTAGEALAGGLVKVRGNAGRLVGAAAFLAEVAEAVDVLRSRTSF